jgi:hypothetical protein
MGDFDPIFPKNVYVDYRGNNCLLDKFEEKCIDKVLNKSGITYSVIKRILDALKRQMKELCDAHKVSLAINNASSKRKTKIIRSGHSGTAKSPLSLASPPSTTKANQKQSQSKARANMARGKKPVSKETEQRDVDDNETKEETEDDNDSDNDDASDDEADVDDNDGADAEDIMRTQIRI